MEPSYCNYSLTVGQPKSEVDPILTLGVTIIVVLRVLRQFQDLSYPIILTGLIRDK